MPLTDHTPKQISNSGLAVENQTGFTQIPTTAGDAIAFPISQASFFIVLGASTQQTLTVRAGQTSGQKEAGVSVDDKTYTIAANKNYIIRTFPALTTSPNSNVEVYASATGLRLCAFR